MSGGAQGATQLPPWWGDFRVPLGEVSRWRIGPRTWFVQRLEHEWRTATLCDPDPLRDGVDPREVVGEPELEAAEAVRRFGVSDSSDQLRLMPRLADRAVVARPDSPFLVPAAASVTIYVGTPLWLSVMRGPEPGLPLDELPIARPSDTWFGPTTKEGELCYASRTHCKTRVEDLRYLPHRAFTPVRIDNQAETALAFERVSIPVHRLALYRAPDSRLWTESVELLRTDDSEFAELSIDDRPPRFVTTKVRLAEPRAPRRNIVVRAFSALVT